MAAPITKTFSKFLLEIGTPGVGDAITWAAPCGFKSKGRTLNAATSKTTLPDCLDPEAPAWEATGITSLSGSITGAGVMATEDSDEWEARFDAGVSFPIRQRVVGVGYREGMGVLSSLGDSVALGTEGNRVQRQMTIETDGPFPWTSGDPA